MSAVVASRHDVVVVGARCAGAATAMLLARAGHDVVLVDRGRPSGDTVSTHSLVRGGVVQLARWGLLDEVLAGGAPPIRSVSFHRYGVGAPEPVRRTVKDKAGVDMMLAPRRHVLDRIVADAAVRAGAALLTGTTVRQVIRNADGRVTGVATEDPYGRRRQLNARLVVGADGVHSTMASHFGAATLESYAPSGTCFYTYVGDVAWDGFEFHLGDDAFAGVFPTHDGQACVWLNRPLAASRPLLSAGAGRLDTWRRTLHATVPGLAHRIRNGSIHAPIRGTAALPNHLRRPTGPGWALVGDAGYHRDPITGHGITDAYRDAELLAEAADRALRVPADEAAAMAGYRDRRHAAIADTFRLTRDLGAFPPPARFVELQTEFGRALDVEALDLAARPVPAVPVG